MSFISDKFNPEALGAANGTQPIGVSQRTIAFASIAAGPTGYSDITANAHGLKKGECVTIIGGAYAGVHRITKVVSANIIRIKFTFGATAAGNLVLLGALNGYGFYVDTVPLTIAELETDNPNVDTASFIATAFIAGTWVSCPFKKLRITAGNCTVVRKPVPTDLAYSNR